MFSLKLFGKERRFYTLDLLFIIFVFAYLFSTYQPWLTNEGLATLTADLNHHLSYYYSFTAHLKEYSWWYPIDYTRDNDGFYWYFTLPLPFIIPTLLSLLFPYYLSFYLAFILIGITVTLALYFFLVQITTRLTALLLTAAFLVGPMFNLSFSVGGHYHFLLGLALYLLTLAFFYRLTREHHRKDLIFFTISYLLLGATYYFSLLIFFLFAIVYLLTQRAYKPLVYLFVLTGILSIFFVPTLLQTLSVHAPPDHQTFSQLLTSHVLPQHATSWLYMESPPYDSTRDQNHGPHIYIAGLLSLALLLYLRERSPTFTFLLTYFLVQIALILIPITTAIIPGERLMYHAYTAFFFLIAYALGKIRIHFYALIAVLLISVYVIGQPFIATQFFPFLLVFGIALLYTLWRKDTHALSYQRTDLLGILFSLIVLFLLIFPITGRVEGTTLYPRVNYFTFPNITNVLNPSDTLYYQGGFTIEHTLLAASASHGAFSSGGANRDDLISTPTPLDVYDPNDATRDLIHFKQINKLIIPVELVQANGKIRIEKIQHLLRWFGNPILYTAYYNSYINGERTAQHPYPLLIFTVTPSPKNYTLTTTTPIRHTLTKNSDVNELTINLQYHPWWHASANGKTIPITNTNGYISFTNVQGITTITLTFSMLAFYLGRVLSILFLLLAFVFFKNYDHAPTILRPNAWIAFLKESLAKFRKKTL